jgi:hypothetical protein
MTLTTLERRLIDAFDDARATVRESPDLFARVTLSLDAARARRRFRLQLAAGIAAFCSGCLTFAFALSDYDNGRITMDWWIIELITDIVLVALGITLGPFIKRFGRSYAADVFRANPRTGKSYLVLTDVAYYLIFASFVLFTTRFTPASNWLRSTGEQLQHSTARVAGMLLIMGILHAGNVVFLPVIGGLLSSKNLHRHDTPAAAEQQLAAVPPLGPGTWVLRIEAGPESAPGTG